MLDTRYFGPRTLPLENEKVGAFVSSIVFGSPDQLSHFCTMGVFSDGNLVAGTVYHNWQQEEGVIELTSGSTTRHWLTRPVIKAMFSLPFDNLGCQLVVLRVSDRNKSMVRIARSFGFDETHIPRLRGRDEGEYIFWFSDDQWRQSRYSRGQ